MKLAWLWLDHVPPGLTITSDVRSAARALARQHRAADPHFMNARRQGVKFMLFTIIPLSMIFTLWVLVPTFTNLIPRNSPWQILNHCGAQTMFFALTWAAIAWGTRLSARPYYFQALCDLGYPVCIACGYNLHNIRGQPNCPECGRALSWLAQGEASEHVDGNTLDDASSHHP